MRPTRWRHAASLCDHREVPRIIVRRVLFRSNGRKQWTCLTTNALQKSLTKGGGEIFFERKVTLERHEYASASYRFVSFSARINTLGIAKYKLCAEKGGGGGGAIKSQFISVPAANANIEDRMAR